MPNAPAGPGTLRGPVFTRPGQGPDLVPPPDTLVGGAAEGTTPAVGSSGLVTNLWRQIIEGCSVSASSPAAMTVDVSAGVIAYDGAHVPVQAVTGLAIAAADPNLDRYDAVVADSTGAVSVLTGTPGLSHAPGDVTKVTLAVVPVLAGVTTITAAHDVRVSPERVPQISQPQFGLADTFGFTFLAGAQSNADPGKGKVGFDNATAGSVAHIYISYFPADIASPQTTITKIDDWLNGASGFPYYLRLWSRQNRLVFMIFKVTALTDHTTYADLTVTFVRQTQADLGAITGNPILATDQLDTIIEFTGEPAGVTSFNGRTGAVVPVDGDYVSLKGVKIILNGTTSYTPTTGTAELYVECQAGGGSSGNGGAASSAGAGGGGGYSASKISSVNAGAHTVAVGAGGSTGANGNAGGNTSFTLASGETGTAPSANGGAAGGTANASTSGAAGGAAGSGDLTAAGGGGGASFWYATGSVGLGGTGGFSFYGSGGAGVKPATAANAGGLYGGGASGSSNQSTASAAGGNGVLRISEFT